MRFGTATDYDRNRGHKRDYVQVWSGSFMGTWEAEGVSLPNDDGYMLTTYNGDRVRVECPTPRNEDTFMEIDRAIDFALSKYYAERA